jgi:hypothetical protein
MIQLSDSRTARSADGRPQSWSAGSPRLTCKKGNSGYFVMHIATVGCHKLAELVNHDVEQVSEPFGMSNILWSIVGNPRELGIEDRDARRFYAVLFVALDQAKAGLSEDLGQPRDSKKDLERDLDVLHGPRLASMRGLTRIKRQWRV